MTTTARGAEAGDGSAEGAARLENLTLWERVHQHLRDEILANRLPPGTVLGEVALAASLGVSRGPVREALGRLAAEGLVTIRPRRGAVVSALTAEEFLEAYQVREALETLAMRLAVPRLGTEGVARLEAIVDEQRLHAEAGDVDAFFAANQAFHELIVETSGNRTLIEMHRQLVGHMGRYRMRSLDLRGSLKRSVGEHARDRAGGSGPATASGPPVSSASTSACPSSGSAGARATRRSCLPDEPRFGVNLNNREPLIAPDYDLPMLLALPSGSRSWLRLGLGRRQPVLQAALRADRAALGDLPADVPRGLGTACMVSSTRNPLYLALEWATLDQLSNGRTILGTGRATPRRASVASSRRSGSTSGSAPRSSTRASTAIRAALDRRAGSRFHGAHFRYDDVSFYSGHRAGPLMPVQTPPPIWVVSNPRLVGDAPPDVMERRMHAACRRIVRYGDGWMTCCRAAAPGGARGAARLDPRASPTTRAPTSTG